MTRGLVLSLALLLPTLAHASDTGLYAPDTGTDATSIINGTDATIDDYPMAGGMIMDGDIQSSFGSGHFRAFLCSSTLIAPDVVLLAGHCLSSDAITGGMGTMTINKIGWSRQADLTSIDGMSQGTAEWPADTVFAKDWVANPNFDIHQMQTGLAENYDIALLFLDTPITDVEPAYLPTVEEATEIAVGDDVEVVGWGQQTATSQLQRPPAGTYALKQMGQSFLNEVSPYEMQVGAVASDVRKCHGDSGGPTFYTLQNTDTLNPMRIIGVTSHAYDNTDCNQKGGVDTRVDHYLTWIDQEMTSRCEDGTRVWCDVPGIIPAPVPKACGCNVAPTAPELGSWGLALLALVGFRRRRHQTY